MDLLEAWVKMAAQGSEVWGAQQGPSVGVTQEMAERAQQQEEWLANKAASGQWGVLHEYWAREHCILLNRASVALGSFHDGLVRMPGDLPPELGQVVMQMRRLLAEHQQRAMADPGAWWKVVTDVRELLPEQLKVLAIVVVQLEVAMVGRIAEVESEEEGE
ncbi:hypothetical protein E4T56_gene725 [Termitomyces sp. T112]|nr:hypothetical protein E4T56_gene725 [Termitomyces sp. T112]